MKIKFTLNGKKVELDTAANKTLLDILRDEINLTGTKEACSTGECGACTVILNRKAVPSCLILAPDVNNTTVTTIEGLAKNGRLDPLQEAFIKHGAIQCAFCSSGFIISAKALFLNNHPYSDNEIFEALEGHLCRCTGYKKILRAVRYYRGLNLK